MSSSRGPVASPPVVRLEGICKNFGELRANDDISLHVDPGEVVAMLGENGAGKSTLMRMVYGLVHPDAGTIAVDGRIIQINSPRAAMDAGIGMVTQEFSLVETMTIAENIALSGLPLGRIEPTGIRRRVDEAMARVGVELDPTVKVSTLSIGERQRVEIVKALFHECRVLILDEPTAVLTPQDVRLLFETVRRLRATGLGVLFVSHKLREVTEIADRVVVLRRGRLVAERRIIDTDTSELANLMMGVSDVDPGRPMTSVAVGLDASAPTADGTVKVSGGRAVGDEALRIRDLRLMGSGRAVLDGVDLTVSAGEILGVAGISGNGQTELMDVVGAVRTPSSGAIEVGGVDVTWAGVHDRLNLGLGRLTEDRRASVVSNLSVEQNLVLEDLESYTRRGVLDQTAIRTHAEKMIAQFDIRAKPTDPIRTLSGGNVQKVLLARALSRKPRVLVVSQPTRGLDVGAFRYVHEQLRGLRAAGGAVVVISEDLDELLSLCDRIDVLFEGRIVGSMPAKEATADHLGMLMAGELVPS